MRRKNGFFFSIGHLSGKQLGSDLPLDNLHSGVEEAGLGAEVRSTETHGAREVELGVWGVNGTENRFNKL
jgi:hypothetical protein